MRKIKPKKNTKTKKLYCDWTDKKNLFILYRILKFYVRHGLVVDKVYEIISFKQRKWLIKNINLNTHNRKIAKNDFEKDFYTFC